ncbi:hypothetical protein C8Q74DRAFT_1372087 [Fomes fomentarius]|nr:hypothetical protein C8Q74DRAFT_1372087 [Fomes fomentarius]
MVAIARPLAAAAAVVAGTLNSRAGNGPASCSLASYKPQFPTAQTTLVAPDLAPNFVGFAFGVQNYTCSDAGAWTAFGAVAEVFDASCFATKPQFATIQNPAFAAWNTSRPPPIQDIIARLATTNSPLVLGQHYFVTNPVTGTGISPKWDFTSSGKLKGNADAFVIGAPKGNIPAPSNPQQNVPWLDIRNVQGKLADQIFRFDTVGGQPPASCTPGKDTSLSVKYVAKYALYGGTIA